MAKGPKDINQIAFDIVARATGQSEYEVLERAEKGGLARATKLSPERRSEIARLAAAKRWGHST